MSNNFKRSSALLLAIVLVVCVFSGCVNGETTTSESPAQQTAESDTWTFTDSAGREVEIPTDIERIIPSGSLAQPFLWPLAADKLVSLNVAFTEEQLEYLGQQYADLPITGNLYRKGSELNIEEVASLNAQIIIDYGEPKDTIAEDLDNLQELLGIPCIFIEGSLDNTAEAYRTLGKLLNRQEKAEEIAEYIDNVMDETTSVLSTIDKKTLACASGSDGLECIASGAFFDAIWAYMGKNVAVADNAQSYWFSTVSMEQLQTWNPEYIFFYTEDGYKNALTDITWSELTAVKNGNCYLIPANPVDFCVLPSVNRYIGIQWLASIMYPDDFDWNIKDEVYNYYKLFYNCDLTPDLYNKLMYIE